MAPVETAPPPSPPPLATEETVAQEAQTEVAAETETSQTCSPP